VQKFKNIGYVREVRDSIVFASGLSEVGYNEVVEIKTSKGVVEGLVQNLDEESVGIIVLGEYFSIKEGDIIESTGKLLSINVTDEILGKVINPLGYSLEGEQKKVIEKGEAMLLEKIAPGIIDRKNVSNELQMNTGILAVDALIPIGRGQRELVIGDRQTGKTALCVDTIINQKGGDLKCIYVAIGQKASKIAQLKAKLEEAGAMDYTVIVAANASDSVSQQYIAPYTGVAIAEYFAQKGQHALIIYDDLTKHAWAYREISLLLRRPPGREAYPGDIFYLHSKLLERAVQLSDAKGGGSITALPIIETQAGDVSAYIPTNIISITDGQIYLESDLFNAGQRPALNVGLSVSRVGSSAQIKAMKKVAGKLKLDFAQFRELQVFAQFGSDLDDTTKQKLTRGERISELLKQPQYTPYALPIQVVLIYTAINGYLDEVSINQVSAWKTQFIETFVKSGKEIAEMITTTRDLTPECEEKIKTFLSEFTSKDL
jgi:F-type H+-transporting ATPase subunit alpha